MKKLLTLTVILLLPAAAFAQKVVKNDDISKYNPEEGYFQKAHVDPSDPRFMISNEDGTFCFGVGGTLRVTPFYDFLGANNGLDFSTYTIPSPTDYEGQFGLSVLSSDIYFKTRILLGKHKLIGMIKIGPNSDYMMKLNQAYISYAGFTAGRAPSLFEDLAAGVISVDTKGVCSQTSRTHAIIAYQRTFGNHWSAGLSIEQPEFTLPDNIPDITILGKTYKSIFYEAQDMPDIVAFGKFKWDFGHVRVAGIFRRLNYWYLNETPGATKLKDWEDFGHKRTVHGWGAAVTGNFNISQRFFITYQIAGGAGVSNYFKDLGGKGMDTYVVDAMTLKAHRIASYLLGAQYQFSNSFVASINLGGYNIDKTSDQQYVTAANYIGLNVFYNINKFFSVGAEVINGMRWSAYDKGFANRATLNAKYVF